MLQTVQKRIKELNMIAPGDKVLVGVSGGADSICLLLVLGILGREMDFSVEAIHVEHGIRGEESIKDAEFVEDVCRHMDILCHMVSVDVPTYCKETGLGTEEAARILRYREFVHLAKILHAKVAVAHNMEDNAETILFQMARGSSLTGLCGMQPVRTDENDVTYIRPLLSVHRKEIESFLHSHGMGYRVDSTNCQLDYSRNYIRKVVLPELQTINWQVVEHINRTANQLSEVRAFLDSETEKAWAQVRLEGGVVKFNVPTLLSHHKAVQKELVYRAIAEVSGGKKDIASIHVEDVLALCINQSGKMVMLPNGVVGKKEFETLYIFGKVEETSTEEDTFWTVSGNELWDMIQSGDTVEIALGNNGEKICVSSFEKKENSNKIPQKTYTKWLDYDKIKAGFCIRTRKSGDYLISDAFGHRKKLKQYFIDEKISARDRNQMWLITQDSLVLWVVGGRISEHVKVTKDTKMIIEITYDGGNENE